MTANHSDILLSNDALLEANSLSVEFRARGVGPLGLGKQVIKAVNSVSLSLRSGERLGIVGESGSGKSTLAQALIGLIPASDGCVRFDGLDIADGQRSTLERLRSNTSMIFQDPYGSLNPMQRVGNILAEVLKVKRAIPDIELAEQVNTLLKQVGLSESLVDRRAHELSGGQCQRVGIARALAVSPRLIVADECVAALDVSIQGQIVNLLMELSHSTGVTLIFIAHDLAIVRRLCDRVAIMYLGQIVEQGPTEQIFAAPRHPYTAALISAIPEIDPDHYLAETLNTGEPPSPLAMPSGCPFHPRCAYVKPCCTKFPGPKQQCDGEHVWRCILRSEELQRVPNQHNTE